MPPKRSPRRAPARPSPEASDVDAFLAELKHPHMAAILALRELILSASPAVREGIKWNAPSFRTGDDFATFHLRAKDGVQLVLHFGAAPRRDSAARDEIDDPSGLLSWKSPDRAIVTFRELDHVLASRAALLAVLRQCTSSSMCKAADPGRLHGMRRHLRLLPLLLGATLACDAPPAARPAHAAAAQPRTSAPRYRPLDRFRGEYEIAFERSAFRPCGGTERWWLAVPGDSTRRVLERALATIDSAAGRPAARRVVYLEIRADTSAVGHYGHLGAYPRQVSVREVVRVAPGSASECR